MYSVILTAALTGGALLPAGDGIGAVSPPVTVYEGYGNCTGSPHRGRLLGRWFHRSSPAGYGCTGGGFAGVIPPVGAPSPAPALSGSKAVPTTLGPAPAQIVVELPADAKLFVEGEPTRSGASRRTLTTLPLEAGRSYSYTLLAELVREGKTYRDTRQVTVQAGTTAAVSFPGLGSGPSPSRLPDPTNQP